MFLARSVFRVFCIFGVLAALVSTTGVFSAQVPSKLKRTRASNIGGMVVGVGQLMHMADFLREYPGCRTAIVCYLRLDSDDVEALISTLHTHAALQEQERRSFCPQIALYTARLNPAAFRRELARPESQTARSVRTLAREIARYRDQPKWYILRPFSEMNDGTPSAPWEFGNRAAHSTPADYAAAWTALRAAFDAEGATNAIFVFSPLAAYHVHHEQDVLDTLNRIPVGAIDAFGLNVYSRPMSAYGGMSSEPIPFADLVQPWLTLLGRSKHRGLPLAVTEMAVSSQATDSRRAQWLRDAFRFARARPFVLLTYFNFPHRYWQIHDGSLAGDVLNFEVNRLY